MNRRKALSFIRKLFIQVFVYSLLGVAYYLLVLKLLGDPLADLFQSDLVSYAVAGVVLVIVQAVFLDIVTSFLVDRLGFGRLR